MKLLWAKVLAVLLRRPSALPADPFGEPSLKTSVPTDPFFEGVKTAAWSPAATL